MDHSIGKAGIISYFMIDAGHPSDDHGSPIKGHCKALCMHEISLCVLLCGPVKYLLRVPMHAACHELCALYALKLCYILII